MWKVELQGDFIVAILQSPPHDPAFDFAVVAGSNNRPHLNRHSGISDSVRQGDRTIDLRIEGDGPITRVLFQTGGDRFVQLGENLESSYLSTDTAGGFQDLTLGMFARN